MRKRTLSRELALQVLYQLDITGDEPQGALDNFWQAYDQPAAEEVKNFTAELVNGVRQNLAAIDEKISRHATNWQIQRMAVVDRNILRLGCYELALRSDIPPKVSINEAVELAKKYSTAEASKFVNGILDKIKEEAKR